MNNDKRLTPEVIEEGYHWVLYEGMWCIALYEKTAYGKGYWYVHGSQNEKVTAEFSQVILEIIKRPV